jgi:hypothetical protein
MFKGSVLGLIVTAVLVATGAATASNGKQRVVVERFVEEFSFVPVDCGDLGPYDFSIRAEGTFRATITDVFGADGTLLQTVLHLQLDETDTNTVSGKSLPLHGAIHEVWDYASNTRTQSGVVFIGTTPGVGTYIQETGRISMTLDTHDVLFLAGPHPAFFEGGIDPAMCAALADD